MSHIRSHQARESLSIAQENFMFHNQASDPTVLVEAQCFGDGDWMTFSFKPSQ